MKILERLRNNTYWGLDKLRGNFVKDALTEIRAINENPLSQNSKRIKNKHLKKILNHAVNTTSYYRKACNFESLADYPVINKNIIRDNYDEFKSRKFNFDKLYEASTSGSTGTPFKVHLSKGKQERNYADNLYFSSYADYQVGMPFCYLRIWNEVNKKNKISHFKQNTYPIDIANLSTISLQGIIKKINLLPERYFLLAYGSTYEAIADYLRESDDKIKKKAKGLFVMAEPLNSKTRNYLYNKFACPVYSRYSNAENGFIGHQWSMKTDEYIMNTGSYKIELLKFGKDEPVANGERGRIVVTDLFNYAIPIIRYDTGDVAVKGESNINGQKRPVFKNIEGRRIDFIYNVHGELISPHTIDYAVRQTPSLIQFQLVQIDRQHYNLKLLFKEKKKGLEEKVLDNLKIYLGKSARIRISFVDEIPVLNSGKRKIVVNKMTA